MMGAYHGDPFAAIGQPFPLFPGFVFELVRLRDLVKVNALVGAKVFGVSRERRPLDGVWYCRH